jgi:DNA repair exonuclease SbcCD ATPase subunit
MKFLSLQISPVLPDGLGSDLLRFGLEMTQLYGPNGSGKTPLIKSISYCLGYPVKFRDDIYSNCKNIILTAEVDGKTFTFTREIDSKNFYIKVNTEGKSSEFFNENDFSKFFFKLINLKTTELITNNNQPTQPYTSTFLPLLYSDQNFGYTDIYRPPNTAFIKDQYIEMIRMAIGSPPRNSFSSKREIIKLKQKIEELDIKIVQKSTTLEQLSKNDPAKSLQEITENISALSRELDLLKNNRQSKNDDLNAADTVISKKRAEFNAIAQIISDLELRISSAIRIKIEIESEIETLGLNEDTRRLFSSFQEICAVPNCGLFMGSAESYGKNLLYLRDQIKDLKRNQTIFENRLAETINLKNHIEREISDLYSLREEITKDGEKNTSVTIATRLTRELIDLEGQKVNKQKIIEQEDIYVSLLNEREEIYENLDALDKNSKSIGIALVRTKTRLLEKIPKWLEIISTHNVSRDITITNEFKISFGAETIDRFDGSTRLRVVLAVRAALFEIFSEDEKSKFKFFILDTPKQHDIQTEHFNNYIMELKILAKRTQSQIIFSSTEYHYIGDNKDKEWNPRYPGDEQLMFLQKINGNAVRHN